jgi:hypothetical protein
MILIHVFYFVHLVQTVDSAMKVLGDQSLTSEQAGKKVTEMLRIESLKQLEAIEVSYQQRT